jgi:DNA primase
MAFAPGFLDELRSRVSLPELIGRRVSLVRRGREYAGLCPFHNERTPSFYVVEDKNFFHCFGCGAHGDAIGFVMRADNLDFLEAVERLAGEAGLAIPQATPEEREKARRQKTLLEILEAAAAFYERQLWSPSGRAACNYLTGRGLDAETMRRFRLGWAPDERTALRRALAGEDAEPLLVEAGLLHRPAQGEPFDYFRGRIMFPIGDRAGRVIAFGGRALGDGQPKYLNSPESAVFEKGRVLYGWSEARAHSERRSDGSGYSPIVTEGYMDVIALHRAGFKAAVAPLGTALTAGPQIKDKRDENETTLTDNQLQELWRLGPEPILCFDGDAAGGRAAVRALRRALPLVRPGQSLRFARLRSGEDPDSIIRTAGRSAFDQILAAALPLCDFLWEVELGGKRLDTPERRADLERRLMESVGLIADRTVQAEYRRTLRDRLFDLRRPARSGSKPVATRRLTFVRDGPEPPPRFGGRIQQENLLRILLCFPWLMDEVAEELSALDFPEPELETLRRQILEAGSGEAGLDARALQQHLVDNGYGATVERLLLPSVDTTFLVRCSDPAVARKEWVRVTRILTGDDRCALTEAANHLISDLTSENWERFLAARERALHRDSVGEDQT